MAAIRTYSTASGKGIAALLTQFGESAVQSLGRQLYLEAQGIISQSQQLCPVDTGALRSSGYVEEPTREGDVMRVELGYGGPASKRNPKTGEATDDYAVFVHENLEAHHPVGMAKFLEIPFNAAQSGMPNRIARGMQSDLAHRPGSEPIVSPNEASAAEEASQFTSGKPIPGG